ncbi:VOC family protein [Smaragdicoccus niigatensis]|uniref:VOC family protein n=1 Tax=Smaragdicoccus niigatensis TaxID=359359 RepID=UPI0003781367|nr:VOC family protein [Smaragdicoccus niigatensis]
MTSPDRYIAGVPCWADTDQPDQDAAAAFYGGLFGWDVENVMPAEAPGKYLIGRLGGGDVAGIAAYQEVGPQIPVWNTYIWVDSVEETADKVRAAGGTVVQGPFDVNDAGRSAAFLDREGAQFLVWEPHRHRGSAVVNEPGSVNFNNLNTRDINAAKEFYGAVFGWETLELGPGIIFWTLPDYGKHLELLNPGTLERFAEFGPAGFENVVAALVPISVDDRESRPNWGITFAVADADETVAKATELGGTVLVPAFEAPWVRMSVLTDPAGAVFTASQFKPENAA